MRMDTPVGVMVASATDVALRVLAFTDEPPAAETPNAVLSQLQSELSEYFAGTRRAFTVPLDPAGTPFQQNAWQMLATIPFGMTRSYGDQARHIGRPTATRAVARANGDNPIAIVIPCHRVIGTNGKLTGYGGGLWRKQWLLDHERGDALALDGMR